MGIYKGLIEFIKIKPTHFMIGVSALVAVVTAWESRSIFIHSGETISDPRVLVAARTLEEGELITFSDLSIGSLTSISPSDRSRFFTDQDLPLVQGKKIIKRVSKGGAIVFDALYSSTEKGSGPLIPQGMRAYFVRTEAFEKATPGGRVNLILKPNSESRTSLVLVENALILSVGNRQSESGIVVALKPEEIEWLEINSRTGDIIVASVKKNEENRGGYGALKKGKQRTQKRFKVEVITEEI